MNPTTTLKRLARRTGLRTVFHTVRRRSKRLYAHVMIRVLRRRIEHSQERLVGTHPVVVSMTSFGRRIDDVPVVIESIGRGRVRPSRLILWIDELDVIDNLPAALRLQQSRGLEILPTEDLGPHKKYFPYVMSIDEHQLPLVTADDDVIYPRSWLRNIMSARSQSPDDVICYRGNVMQVDESGIAPYDQWPRCHVPEPSLKHFATGVGGIMYPPAMLDEVARRGRAFEHTAPRADDVWLHWVALQTRRKVRQVTGRPRHFPALPGSQEVGLVHENVREHGNDAQIAALYTTADIEVLRRAP